MRRVVAAGLIGVLLAASARARALDPQTPQAPVFRGGTLLVPIDLRVLDRLGQSITGLTAADITVREDSVVQDVKYFSATTLSPEREAVRSPPVSRRPPGADLITPNRRVFLIVLGRGRLQEPAKGLDGLLRFVRERLLPQDLVAVLGYDRATDFTTDHQRVAAVLERFRSRHESIEQNLRTHFSGLAGVYGSKLLPKSIQADIDTVFRAPTEAIADRELPPAPAAFRDRLEGDERLAIDAGLNLASSSFGDFVSSNRQTMQDVGNLYTGIEYLRHLDGEKHLIFVTEFGFSLPRMEDDRGLAAMAADARVVIDTIQTGGIPGSEVPDARLPAAPLTVAPTRQSVATAALKTVSELTGGLSSLNEYAATAIDRLNAATRSGYLLGYTPTNSAWDGRFRKISITVDRKDVTVLYRRGYYARTEMLPFDRQQFVTSSRMNAAASFRREIRDIKLNARTSRAAGAPDAVVDVTIDTSRLHFADAAGRHQANLAVALVCLDSAQRVVSQFAEQVGFPLDEAEFARVAKDGLGYSGRVGVPPQGRTIKVVVYDRAADLIGTIVVPVR